MLPLPWLLTIVAGPPQDSTLTLLAAAERMLAVHPRAEAAAASVAGAEAGQREARSRWFPDLTASGSATRFRYPMIVAPIHELSATQIAFDRTLIQGDLRLAFTVFDGGARTASIRAAGAAADAERAGARATQADLMRDAAGHYLAVTTAAAVLAAQQDGEAALQAERARVAMLVAEGTAARVDLLRVDAALADATAAVVAAAADLDAARHGFARALDVGDVQVTQLEDLRWTGGSLPERDTLLVRMSGQSPDLEAARQARREAQAQRSRAKAAWLPRVELQGAVIAYGDAQWDFRPEWQVGARVYYPVFTGGQRSGAVARATAYERAAAARVRDVEDQLADALDRALAQVTAARANVAALEASTVHLAEVARIEALSLASGAGTQAEYLRAEAAARSARARLATARATQLLADIDLARLTGDLSLAWMAANLEATP